MFSDVSQPPAKQRASESDWAVRNWSTAKEGSSMPRFRSFISKNVKLIYGLVCQILTHISIHEVSYTSISHILLNKNLYNNILLYKNLENNILLHKFLYNNISLHKFLYNNISLHKFLYNNILLYKFLLNNTW